MDIEMRSGVDPVALLDELRRVQKAAQDLIRNETTWDGVSPYKRWLEDAVGGLSLYLPRAEIDRLVRTANSWRVLALPRPVSYNDDVTGVAKRELQERVEDLQAAYDAAEHIRHWRARGHVVVADTNVYLHHTNTFDHMDWNSLLDMYVRSFDDIRLVIPLLVIDELDRSKQGQRDVRSRARTTLATISHLLGGSPNGRATFGDPENGPRKTVELFFDPAWHTRLPDNDDELIDRTLAIQALVGHRVRFVTGDTGAFFRARRAGLDVLQIPWASDDQAT
jgi:hypothetical protein